MLRGGAPWKHNIGPLVQGIEQLLVLRLESLPVPGLCEIPQCGHRPKNQRAGRRLSACLLSGRKGRVCPFEYLFFPTSILFVFFCSCFSTVFFVFGTDAKMMAAGCGTIMEICQPPAGFNVQTSQGSRVEGYSQPA